MEHTSLDIIFVVRPSPGGGPGDVVARSADEGGVLRTSTVVCQNFSDSPGVR